MPIEVRRSASVSGGRVFPAWRAPALAGAGGASSSFEAFKDPRHRLQALEHLRPLETDFEGRLRALNIEHLYRFSDARLLREIMHNREARALDPDRPAAVLVYPKFESSHAFKYTSIDKLRSHGFQVLYYEAGSDHELVEALQDAASKGRARYVELAAHGAMRAMAFGLHPDEKSPDGMPADRDALDWSDLDMLKEANLEGLLADDAVIQLNSCSTGFGMKGAPNIANLVAEVFPRATVYAPAVPATSNPTFDAHGVFVSPGYNTLSTNVYRVAPREREETDFEGTRAIRGTPTPKSAEEAARVPRLALERIVSDELPPWRAYRAL